jgi:hypothetical protein
MVFAVLLKAARCVCLLHEVEDGIHSVQPDTHPTELPGRVEAGLCSHLALHAHIDAIDSYVRPEPVHGCGAGFFLPRFLERCVDDFRFGVHQFHRQAPAIEENEFQFITVDHLHGCERRFCMSSKFHLFFGQRLDERTEYSRFARYCVESSLFYYSDFFLHENFD